MDAAHNDAWSEALGGECPGEGEVFSLGSFQAGLAPAGALEAVKCWLGTQGIGVCGAHELAYACRGAPFHHDGESFSDRGFCVVWLSDDTRWDLVFPFAGERVALDYGTMVIFDPAQPHGVVRRGAERFDFGDFQDEPLGVFASVDFKLGAKERRLLGVRKLSRRGCAGKVLLKRGITSEDLDEETGVWCVRSLSTNRH